MDDALAVHVDHRVANLAGEVQRAFGLERPLVAHDRAQRDAVDVLHRDVHPAFVPGREHLDDVGMIEAAADCFLALEAAVKNDVALELQVGHLDRYGRPAQPIDGLEDRRHPAARDEFGELVLIEILADIDLAHHWQSLHPQRMRADVNTGAAARATRTKRFGIRTRP